MITFRLPKCRSASTLIILLLTLQITACGTENLATAITPDIGTSTTTDVPGGNNRTAVISGIDIGSVIEDVDPDNNNLLAVNGKLYVTDSSGNEAAFINNTITGDYGSLVIDSTGNWLYTVNNAQPAIQNLTAGATLTDNLIVSSVTEVTHAIVITIIGVDETVTSPPNVNQPALISGVSTGIVMEDIAPDNDNLLEVSAKLNIIDVDIGEAAFIANAIAGDYGDLIIHTNGNWHYAANNSQPVIQNLATGATLTDSLVVSSIDGTTHTIVITIFGVDENTATTNITLSWVAPAAREDNSALSLSAIAGYKIYYSTAPGQYSNSASINDGTATGYIFNNFTSATYYFVVTTIDTDGRESQYSTEITISI